MVCDSGGANSVVDDDVIGDGDDRGLVDDLDDVGADAVLTSSVICTSVLNAKDLMG